MQSISNSAMVAEPSLTSRGFENVRAKSERYFALDTTFVLFFLALDFGQAWFTYGSDGVLSVVTLMVFITAPYLLPFSREKRGFGEWVMGRIVVAAAGLTLGLIMKQAIGVLLPETFSFLPMTLLIVAAIISCYVQIYGIIRFRLAS